ncbi:J protein JJJ1 [Nakaseomyces bracarensis]|uniref:J protein JJJ1 n=1 Tax=Nakaseomyces bracarensis TaxID=273131 RepID=A0ABR4NYA3_9SACH
MKTCYYELLGVEAHASDLELKKAYRKKALQYHPDKNPDNIDEATAIFAEIRAAYEVLADPQERAWYDSHKDQILSDTPLSQYDDEDDYVVDSAVTGVTTEELLMFFNTSLYTKIDNSPAGFYQIAGRVFAKLAKDEVQWGLKLGLNEYQKLKDIQFEENINSRGYLLACDSLKADLADTLFPIFGYSSMPYDELKEFYKKWSSFTTLKSFSWKDEYMYSRNYDRRTKREISKRNEKARTKAKEEYIKTVKRYVSFIKKMDKRMKEGAKKAEEQRKIDEKLRKEAAKIAREQKMKNKTINNFELQSWQTVDQENWEELERQYERDFKRESERGTQSDIEDVHNEASYINLEDKRESEEEIIIYDCYICNKTFKSEKQLENHNNTKLHKKNLAKIQKEMKKDSMALGLDDLSDYDEFDSAVDENDGHNYHDMELDDIDRELQEIEKQLAEQGLSDTDEEEESEFEKTTIPINVEIEIDDNESVTELEQTPNTEPSDSEEEDKEDEIAKLLRELEENKKRDDEDDDEWGTKAKKKKTKSKSKKPIQSDKDTLDTGDIGGTEKCTQCNAAFHSRNKLFEHIKKLGHAAPISKKKKKKKRK